MGAEKTEDAPLAARSYFCLPCTAPGVVCKDETWRVRSRFGTPPTRR
jgi:hypothetical protein